MALQWKDAYSVGHVDLDGDHQKLFAIANEFSASADPTAAQMALSRLLDYANGHFGREEAVLGACCGKPETRYFHHQSHEVLTNKLRQLILRFGGMSPGKAGGQLVKDTAILLEMWIFNHVVKEDVKIRPMIQQKFAKKK